MPVSLSLFLLTHPPLILQLPYITLIFIMRFSQKAQSAYTHHPQLNMNNKIGLQFYVKIYGLDPDYQNSTAWCKA